MRGTRDPSAGVDPLLGSPGRRGAPRELAPWHRLAEGAVHEANVIAEPASSAAATRFRPGLGSLGRSLQRLCDSVVARIPPLRAARSLGERLGQVHWSNRGWCALAGAMLFGTVLGAPDGHPVWPWGHDVLVTATGELAAAPIAIAGGALLGAWLPGLSSMLLILATDLVGLAVGLGMIGGIGFGLYTLLKEPLSTVFTVSSPPVRDGWRIDPRDAPAASAGEAANHPASSDEDPVGTALSRAAARMAGGRACDAVQLLSECADDSRCEAKLRSARELCSR